MNVTIHAAPLLKGALDGRVALELGVPSSASVGDVLQSLLVLYPRLSEFIINEVSYRKPHFRAVLGSGMRGPGLYLFAEGDTGGSKKP